MKFGDKLFTFDVNRRVYSPGKGFPPPIYREHFRPVEVIGETSRSWVIGTHGREYFKTPKRDPFSKNLYTADMVEDECWKKDEVHRIISDVRRADGATLRAIDELLKTQKPKERKA